MKKFLSILLCVCLMFTTVMAVPSVSAEEQAKEYFYHFNDFESLANDEAWLAAAKQGTTMSVENGSNIISGNQSLKVTTSGAGYNGFALSNVGVPVNLSTRVSFDYKVTVGTKGWSGVGYIGHTKATNSAGEADFNCYNWSNVNGENYSNKVTAGFSNTYAASATILKFKNTITRNDKGTSQLLGIFMNDGSAPLEVIFDNVKIAEIINTVSAVSDNEAKGTVSVANKEAKYTDYAMGETAVFTATPAEGYSFKGWYNGDELVSTEATYEHTLTGDTTLTAKWKLFEKDYFYHFNDFESLTNDEAWLAAAKQGTTMSVENGSNKINGNQSLKVTSAGNGYNGFALSDVKVDKNVKTRVSFDYKVTVGSKGWSGVGYIGYTKATNSAGEEGVQCYNWSNVQGGAYSNSVTAGFSNTYAASASIRNFKNTITRNDKGTSQPLGVFINDGSAPLEIIFDNVKIAEIIDTVAVVNSDETKGTVSVANKETKYTDYAKGEVAVFTATPAEGYSFKGWYNSEDELVSTSATYEHTLTTDTTLTAKWKLYEKEYDYKAYDYENYFNDSFPYNGIVNTYSKDAEGAVSSIVSEETANPISGNSSYKYFFGNGDTNWAFLTPKTAENKLINGATYRVSGKYAVQQNTIAVMALAFGGATALFQTNSQDATARVQGLNGKYESGYVYSFNGKITTVNAGYPAMHGYTKGDYTTDYVLLDDIVYAQIIDTVSATSDNTSMGSATVVNKAGYEDYAKNEIAVFTAVPNNGYYLEGWYNANGEKVSTDKVYEVALTTDTNLTAKFAAYDELYTISFNTNGGTDIDSISNGEGADIVFPEAPVKAGFVFAGWYTDADLTAPFTATTFPAEDVTLFAKWAGSYQDFENYTATPSGNFEVMTDGENAYLGNGYLKYSADATDSGSRLVISSTEALKDFATPGDQIKISLKYKLLSGDARFYIHTSNKGNTPNLTKTEKGDWLNAYKHKSTNFVVSEEWQELTATYDLKSYTEVLTEGFTVEDFLYSVFFVSSTNGAELYVDEITLDVIPGVKIKTAYNNAAALRSAEASSTGKNGLRIYNEIDTHWVEAQNIVEYGSVAAFASNINGEITLENGKKGVAYSAAAGINSVWEVTDHTVVFTSYLTNIGSARYDEEILIRSYAVDANGTVYYGKTATVSVFEVANAIDNANTADGSEVSEEDANAFYTFVNSANKAAYEAWCNANGKTVGALYNAK